MHLSLNWLKTYVDLDGLAPETIADALTRAGLEVEGLTQTGGTFEGVRVARILAVDPHPNADRLRLVTVTLGANETMQVVCGAPNVQAGMWIAFAPVGANVYSPRQNEMFTLTPAKIRGVSSEGMICSLDELGLLNQFAKGEDGIWPLTDVLGHPSDDSPLLGQPLREALKLVPDTLLEATPTVNRGDQMAMVEVARELSVLFQRPLNLLQPTGILDSLPASADYSVILTDPKLCPTYMALVVDQVTLKPSPAWMQQRLLAAGITPRNNLVDITNYVMLELGQPLHAFDREQLGPSGMLSVRRAESDETLTTLDGQEHPLTTDSMLITHNNHPVALAGVMGGDATKITENTRSLVLESACFVPATLRRSAKSVGIRSDASARYERGVDPQGCRRVLERAAQLLLELADAKGLSLTDACLAPQEGIPEGYEATQQQSHTIGLRVARVSQILGITLDPAAIEKILTRLGFAVETDTSGHFRVQIPSRRLHDLTREIDLIEEIGRIYGFDKIPSTLPVKTQPVSASPRQQALQHLRHTLQGAGLQEWVTPSLVGEALWQRNGLGEGLPVLRTDNAVQVLRANSAEHTILRQTLLPNLLEVLRFNLAQGESSVWGYELGRGYLRQGTPSEKETGVTEWFLLAGILSGNPLADHWHLQQATDFYTLKGILEVLIGVRLESAPPVCFVPMDFSTLPHAQSQLAQTLFHPGRSAQLVLGTPQHQQYVGILGELHPAIQAELKASTPIYAFELAIDPLFGSLWETSGQKMLRKPSSYPAVQRDVAFLVPLSVSHQQVLQTLEPLLARATPKTENAGDAPILQTCRLFDEYRGASLPEGFRSLAYRFTLQSFTDTLSDTRIEQTMRTVRECLETGLSVQMR